LIAHPELAGTAGNVAEARHLPDASTQPPEWAWDELRRQYAAAMYLQRMWRTRLNLCLGERPLIPERFSAELDLPAADVMYGEMGLRTLTDRSAFNDWSSYEQVVDLLCDQPCRTPEADNVRP
jgi:hypothetical protein